MSQRERLHVRLCAAGDGKRLGTRTLPSHRVYGDTGTREDQMSPPDKKETRTLRVRESDRRRNNALTGILSTAAGAILMLTAFSAIPDPTMKLVVVSVGGLLIGGSR
jgi:hypothetical protein